MVFSIICFSTVIALTWGVRRNWRRNRTVKHLKRLLIWSPILRCIMMTWFATALWTFTWFHASVDGFKDEDQNLTDRRRGTKGGARRLVADTSKYGLSGNYPTKLEPEEIAIMPLIKLLILFAFPIISYLLIQKNYARLSQPDFKTKFSTLYTDMIHKHSAKHVIVLLCGRRLLLALTTVFWNHSLVPNLLVYFYGSIFLLSYYVRLRPFDNRWAYWLELLNETHVMVAAYSSLFFTAWADTVRVRYQYSSLFVDVTVWVIIVNQVGIFYEAYSGVRLWHLKKTYEIAWRNHYRTKNYLSLLLMEYWNYFDVYKQINNYNLLMSQRIPDLEAKLLEMRKRKQIEDRFNKNNNKRIS